MFETFAWTVTVCVAPWATVNCDGVTLTLISGVLFVTAAVMCMSADERFVIE